MATGKFIGVTLSPQIYEYIQKEIDAGLFSSPSDWIRQACREYYEKRKQGRQGGGALISSKGYARASALGARARILRLYTSG